MIIKLTRIDSNGIESLDAIELHLRGNVAKFPPAVENQFSWRVYVPLTGFEVTGPWYLWQDVEEPYVALTKSRHIPILYNDSDLTSIVLLRETGQTIQFPAAESGKDFWRIFGTGDPTYFGRVGAHYELPPERLPLPILMQDGIFEQFITQGEESSIWSCDNHPPGLEVPGIPKGEHCPVCLGEEK